jgi:hypothetical protein
MGKRNPATAQGCRRAGLLPSFFVIGPPRTGTSWIHEVLRRHTTLPAVVKETRFFDVHFDRGWEWYLRQFPKKGKLNAPRGEIAPTYFASPHARSHIAEVTPDAKVVCIFRNPVERFVSLYRVKRAYGMIRCGFMDALLSDCELVESAKYASHLKHWWQVLGKDQVLPTLYEQLRDDPQGYVDVLADFIGIKRIRLTSMEMQAVHRAEGLTHPRVYHLTHAGSELAQWLKTKGFGRLALRLRKSPVGRLLLRSGQPFEALTAEHARMAYELVRGEVEEMEALLKWDLSAWKPREPEAGQVRCQRDTSPILDPSTHKSFNRQ